MLNLKFYYKASSAWHKEWYKEWYESDYVPTGRPMFETVFRSSRTFAQASLRVGGVDASTIVRFGTDMLCTYPFVPLGLTFQNTTW